MKTSKIIILTLLSTLLLSCGGKKDDENQQNLGELQQRLRQQQLNQQNQNNQNTSINTETGSSEQGPVTEQLNDLYFALRSSGIDMQPIDDGRTILVQCQTFESIDEINLCRIGYTHREIQLGEFYINKGFSEEIYHNLQSEALARSLMNEEPLAINCKDKCQISHALGQNR